MRRMMSALPHRARRRWGRWDADTRDLERRFLGERRASVELELERRVDDFTKRHRPLSEAILRFARDPLPDAWGDAQLPIEITAGIRPPRREIETIAALEAAVGRRPLVEAIDRMLRRVEDDELEALRDIRATGRYGDAFWSDELLEQILSHLVHLWALWLDHYERTGLLPQKGPGP
jgi:hypothetical protein